MSTLQGFKWSSDNYIKHVEETEFPMLKEYEEKEIEFLKNISDSKEKTFVDVGAGYGRVLPTLKEIARNVVAVEIDDQMFTTLEKKASGEPNFQIINGDANNLSSLVKNSNLVSPVVVCLQNSIGPWIGDYRIVLRQMREVAKTRNGEVVLSSFRQEAFSEYAMAMYNSAAGLVGEVDLDKCDPNKGIFVSKTGYKSKWWTKEERDEMKQILGGTLISEVSNKPYFIFHVKY